MRSDVEDNLDPMEVIGNESSDDMSSDTFIKATAKSVMNACPFPGCSMMFSRPSRLETHKRIHTGERPYACKEPGCGKAYMRPTHLKRHMINSHAKVKADDDGDDSSDDDDDVASVKSQTTTFECKSCPKKFSTRCSLKKHEKVAHSADAKRYPCTTCGQTFAKKSWLTCHIASHNGELPHKCSKCGKSFAVKNKLERHMQTHEHKCETCLAVFPSFSELRKHKSQAHSSKDRKTCPICEHEFKSRSQLRQHYVTHSDARDVYKCTYPMCSRMYFNERNLKQHIQAYHELQRFSCNFEGCDAKLSTRGAMVRHMKTAHENLPKPKKVRKSKPHKKHPKLPIAAMLTGAVLPRNVEREIIVEGKTFELSLPELSREVAALKSDSEAELSSVSTKVVENGSATNEMSARVVENGVTAE